MFQALSNIGSLTRILFSFLFAAFWGYQAYQWHQMGEFGPGPPTVIGVSALAGLSGLAGLIGLIRFMARTASDVRGAKPESKFDDSADSAGFDADEIMARYIAQRESAPKPTAEDATSANREKPAGNRPQFGRKQV